MLHPRMFSVIKSQQIRQSAPGTTPADRRSEALPVPAAPPPAAPRPWPLSWASTLSIVDAASDIPACEGCTRSAPSDTAWQSRRARPAGRAARSWPPHRTPSTFARTVAHPCFALTDRMRNCKAINRRGEIVTTRKSGMGGAQAGAPKRGTVKRLQRWGAVACDWPSTAKNGVGGDEPDRSGEHSQGQCNQSAGTRKRGAL